MHDGIIALAGVRPRGEGASFSFSSRFVRRGCTKALLSDTNAMVLLYNLSFSGMTLATALCFNGESLGGQKCEMVVGGSMSRRRVFAGA